MCDEITHPFPNFTEVLERVSSFIPYFTDKWLPCDRVSLSTDTWWCHVTETLSAWLDIWADGFPQKAPKCGAITHLPYCIIISSHPWQCCHNGSDAVSKYQPHDCLLNRLFKRRSKKTSKLRVTALCAGNSPVTGKLPAWMASNAENVSIWWRHHVQRWLHWYRTNDGNDNVNDIFPVPMKQPWSIWINKSHQYTKHDKSKTR